MMENEYIDQCNIASEWKILSKLSTKQEFILSADFGLLVLPIYEEAFPHDARPNNMIEAKYDYADGRIVYGEFLNIAKSCRGVSDIHLIEMYCQNNDRNFQQAVLNAAMATVDYYDPISVSKYALQAVYHYEGSQPASGNKNWREDCLKKEQQKQFSILSKRLKEWGLA